MFILYSGGITQCEALDDSFFPSVTSIFLILDAPACWFIKIAGFLHGSIGGPRLVSRLYLCNHPLDRGNEFVDFPDGRLNLLISFEPAFGGGELLRLLLFLSIFTTPTRTPYSIPGGN